MVQGQTAQKFFTYDEGDVWWHPGHSSSVKKSILHLSLSAHPLDFQFSQQMSQSKFLLTPIVSLHLGFAVLQILLLKEHPVRRPVPRSSHEYNGVLYINLLRSGGEAIWGLDATAAKSSGSGCDGCLPLSNSRTGK